MSNVLIFDPVNGNAIQYLLSVNTPDYEGKPGNLINPDMIGIESVPIKYIKVVDSLPVEMTAEEKAFVDAAEPPPQQSPIDIIVDRLNTMQDNLNALNANYPDIAAQFPAPVVLNPKVKI
jgi:hypothetical protein